MLGCLPFVPWGARLKDGQALLSVPRKFSRRLHPSWHNGVDAENLWIWLTGTPWGSVGESYLSAIHVFVPKWIVFIEVVTGAAVVVADNFFALVGVTVGGIMKLVNESFTVLLLRAPVRESDPIIPREDEMLLDQCRQSRGVVGEQNRRRRQRVARSAPLSDTIDNPVTRDVLEIGEAAPDSFFAL